MPYSFLRAINEVSWGGIFPCHDKHQRSHQTLKPCRIRMNGYSIPYEFSPFMQSTKIDICKLPH